MKAPVVAALVVLILAAIGCATPPSAGQPPPGAAPPATGGATPTGAGPGDQWAETVAAARREGRVVVLGPQGNETREALTQSFQRRYPDIQVEYNGLAGSPLAAKLQSELAAGQYLTDVAIVGTTTAIEILLPANALAPIQPYLSGPALQDPAAWRGGKLAFADSAAQHALVFSTYVKPPFIYNPNAVSPDEFSSYHDLLQPRWKGKLVMRDPRIAGGGLAAMTFLYTTEGLGKEYIRQLFTQDVVISNDDRQIIDWVARGQYPIALGVSDTLANEFIGRGLPVRHMETARMREGGYVTAGNGVVSVVRNAPHPNATRVYLDHLLSREGQLDWSKAAGFASARRDAPSDHVPAVLVPQEGVVYQDNHAEQYVRLRGEIIEFLKPVIP